MARIARVSVERRRPWRSALGLVALCALLAGAGYLGYRRLVEPLATLAEVRAGQLAVARREAGRLQADNLELEARLAGAERTLQVERAASGKVKQRLAALQEEILGLKRQVAFYRDIVGPQGGPGVRVQTFLLWPESGGGYHYEVVLTRGQNDGKVIEGTVRLAVAGEQGGQGRRLVMEELGGDRPGVLGFRFRYFQRLEGRLDLPAGFVPHAVSVEVAQSGRGRAVVRDFDWPVPAG